MKDPTRPSDEPVRPEDQKKRTYEPPRLVEYGDVAKLTTGGSGFESEGASGMVGMM